MQDVELAPLTREEAVLLTSQIAKALTLSWDLIVRAYHGRAWEPLGYETWDAYCRGEFGQARLALPAEERREKIRSLREHGLSLRAIGAATGVSRMTVHNDLNRPGVHNLTPAVTGIDGKTYEPTVIDAEIVEEEEHDVPETRATPRVALPKTFQRPVTDVHRNARRLAELRRDDRFSRNAPLLSDLYMHRLVEAHEALTELIEALQKRNGAA